MDSGSEDDIDEGTTKFILHDSKEETVVIESAIEPFEKYAFGDFWLCVVEECIHLMINEGLEGFEWKYGDELDPTAASRIQTQIGEFRTLESDGFTVCLL